MAHYFCVRLKFKTLYMKKLLFFCLALLTAGIVTAQSANPVKWTYESKKVGENEFDLLFTADVEKGWYVYSQHLDDDGPIPTSFHFNDNSQLEKVGETTEKGQRHEGYDEIFAMNLVKFSGKVLFTQRVKIKSPTALTGYLEFMTCDNEKCLPPMDVRFGFELK